MPLKLFFRSAPAIGRATSWRTRVAKMQRLLYVVDSSDLGEDCSFLVGFDETTSTESNHYNNMELSRH